MEIIGNFYPGFWQAFLATLFSGGVIGLERQMRGKPAGVRTAILICFGTQMFVQMGSHMDGTMVDASRVLGQVVTGIGFLGAGVMFANAGVVTGVTTAAVIWVLAAVGAMIGLGNYMAGCVVAVLTVAILVSCEFLEQSFKSLRQGAHSRVNGSCDTSESEESKKRAAEGAEHERRGL